MTNNTNSKVVKLPKYFRLNLLLEKADIDICDGYEYSKNELEEIATEKGKAMNTLLNPAKVFYKRISEVENLNGRLQFICKKYELKKAGKAVKITHYVMLFDAMDYTEKRFRDEIDGTIFYLPFEVIDLKTEKGLLKAVEETKKKMLTKKKKLVSKNKKKDITTDTVEENAEITENADTVEENAEITENADTVEENAE